MFTFIIIIRVFICSLFMFNTTVTLSHMLMSSPIPRGFKGNPSYPAIDYDLNSPMPSATMCKGKPPGAVVQTLQAGQSVPVSFQGSARHGGGICQFSLSYDNDRSFVVFEEIIGPCPDQAFQWNVELPNNLPNCERCTFAWSWFNAIGNREMYMNCADVKIVGSGDGKISGRPILIANFPGHATIYPAISRVGGPQSAGIKTRRFPVQIV